MPTLPLDVDTHDLAIEADGSMALISGPAEVAQKLRVRLRWFKGEWFMDGRLGTPYFQEILRHHPDADLIRAIFRKILEGCPGVARVDSLTSDWDRGTRQLDVRFHLTLTDGGVLRSEDYGPFLVEV